MSPGGREDLAGKRILLTGASRGIGADLARSLAGRGARLVLVARDRVALAEVTSGLEGEGHEAYPMDVADDRAWRELRARVGDVPLDGVVTAAALLVPIGPIGTWDVAAFRATLDVNVVGTLSAVTTFLDDLRRTRGSVVTFSGGGATSPMPRYDAYAASKAAVVRLTENMALELAPDGVRANSVAPGFIATAMHQATISAGAELAGADYLARTRAALEQGGDPPELAVELVGFLLSEASRGITGKLISARWDPWQDGAFQDRLRTEASLATLRRIDDQFYAAIA